MRIRATTRLLAVVGDPVGHSLSPAMHNAAIAALGLDAAYLALRTSREAFPELARALVGAGGGLNVTIPFKRAAAGLLDRPSESVRRSGACNTLWADDTALAGDNTDVSAVRTVASGLAGPHPVRRALVLGTGGSARAVAVAVADGWPGAEIAVVSRDGGRAADFAAWGKEAGVGVTGVGIGEVSSADLIVNATPLGLDQGDPPPIDAATLRRLAPAAVLDLVYARGGTALVRVAREIGIAAADGRGVLVAQGAASFERWFGVPAPVTVMRAAVEDALRG
ncbi:MAG TPA: shikimate dehydrogenase [Gemmatimonadales bacterium]|nr:shikimate dehydrogenase [Gemmatimonadales bacterium]